MRNLLIVALLLGSAPESWLERDDSNDRVLAIEARARHIANNTIPGDARHVVIIENAVIAEGIYGTYISDIDQKKSWSATELTPDLSLREAFMKYRAYLMTVR